MADPLTTAAWAVSQASGITSSINQIGAHSAQARVDDANAAAASAQANEREEQARRQGRQALGEQVAGIGESGIGFTQTTRDLMDQSAANVSMDALNARYQGAMQRTNFMNAAAQERAAAKAARVSGVLGYFARNLQFAGASAPSSAAMIPDNPVFNPADLSSDLPGLDGISLPGGG